MRFKEWDLNNLCNYDAVFLFVFKAQKRENSRLWTQPASCFKRHLHILVLRNCFCKEEDEQKDKSECTRYLIPIPKQPGFTLLEVLIGMSLLSVMMLLLFASLRICVQNWNAGENKIAQVSQAAIVQNFLRNKLHATLPLEDGFSEEQQFSFQGEEDWVQFVAAMPASASRLGLQIFKLSLVSSTKNKGTDLLVDIKPFFPQAEAEEWGEEQVVILKNIQRLSFAYFGDDDFNGESAWQSEWLEKHVLPKLVSIDVELTNGEVWPKVVVALKVNAAADGSSPGSLGNPFGIVDGKFTN